MVRWPSNLKRCCQWVKPLGLQPANVHWNLAMTHTDLVKFIKVAATQRFVVYCSSPSFGEMIQFDENIFQMGWFNHQLVIFSMFKGHMTYPCPGCHFPADSHEPRALKHEWTSWILRGWCCVFNLTTWCWRRASNKPCSVWLFGHFTRHDTGRVVWTLFCSGNSLFFSYLQDYP